MSTLSELKKLHEKGLALIYLKPKEKRPIEEKWTSQKAKSWDELENSHEPSYNVGVRLGEPSKLPTGKYLGAIDCDVKSKSRKALTEMNDALRQLGIDLDSAPIVMSGRGNGSKHIYVQTDSPMKPMKYVGSELKVKVLMPGENKNKKPHSKRELEKLTPEERAQGYRIRPAWEISFMGTGQQTVLPPSVHPDTGMKYAWASPLMVKHLPTFKPGKFAKQEKKGTIGEAERVEGLNFKAVDVNLYESKLSVPLIKIIETGQGCEDRSASLFSVTLAMCRHGFKDNEILSVLSNPDNWIAEAAYEHTQSRSRERAVRWLYKYTLLKARHETDIMRRFDNPPPKAAPLTKKEKAIQEEDIQADRDRMLPDLDGQGKPKPTIRNLVHILEHFLGGGLIGYDEFANRVVFLKDTPYQGVKGKQLTDQDDLNLSHYVACNYRFEPSTDMCFKAHALVARKHGFHPVRHYLERLTWDQVPRLDTWLKTAFGASGPREYLNAVSRKVLVAAVARVFEPGCKFDYVMVLEGFQGKGKSTALRILASTPWFTDGLGDIYQKDVVDQMTGKWLIELGELASIRKAEIEGVKAFMSRQVDRVRPPYGRRSEDFERQSIFIGSTNNSEYFTDETGNRRFWPVKIEQANFSWLKANRDQLWAEAVTRYELGENIYLSPELEAVANREQDKRFEVDDWEAEVKRIVSKSDETDRLTSTDIWRAIHVNDGGGHPPKTDTMRIGKIMRRIGYVRETQRIEGIPTKCWMKK